MYLSNYTVLYNISGKFYLADCGYANRKNFLTPFRSTRYHLKEFTGGDSDPRNKEEMFNHRHACLRNVIERIFGIFKSRFLIFKSAPSFPYKTQAELVLACAALHNYLRQNCRSDEFPPEEISDEQSATQPNTSGSQFPGTQEQQRELANEWRETIASNMWNAAIISGSQR